MPKEKLILVPSPSMDENKKEDRKEDNLIRMTKSARDFMGFGNEVEIYPEVDKVTEKLKRSTMLSIFQAYAKDIKHLKEEEGFTVEQLRRVGFVTTKTYQRVTNARSNPDHRENVWITDKISDTVIGADPEFLLFDTSGKIVRANNIMSKSGLIGSDGAMAELRPHPEISPEGLTANIMALLTDKQLTNPIKQYDWVAGCYFKDQSRDYPIGGHIHIGNPTRVASMERRQRFNFFNVFNKILDEKLALPLMKMDGTELGRARRSECQMGKYGYYGEWRPCDGRLEHRTLSGMWLMHPELTTLVIGVAKAIIDEVFRKVEENNYKSSYTFPDELMNAGISDSSHMESFKHCGVWKKEFNSWKDIPLARDLRCLRPSGEMISLLNNSSATKINKPFLDAWYTDMRNLSTYQTYSKYVDGLYDVLKTPQKAFKEHEKSIKKNWLEKGKLNL